MLHSLYQTQGEKPKRKTLLEIRPGIFATETLHRKLSYFHIMLTE